jgi:hypothetical protein
MFVLSSALTLGNSFTKDLGDDDSILSNYQYRASWLLMTISGVFCTLGSLAFMRAVHEDPPMKPLFKWYHFQSDELLGSWLFLLATLPIIPYSLIYISASDGDLVYLGALAVSILLVIGSYLFVRACYPSEAGVREYDSLLLHPSHQTSSPSEKANENHTAGRKLPVLLLLLQRMEGIPSVE